MRLSLEPPAWAGRYVGIPFSAGGRGRDGLDCWGLVALVHLERFGAWLPSYVGRYSDVRAGVDVGAVMAEELAGGRWAEIPEPSEIGDVLRFRVGKGWHVGVAVARGVMLHASAEASSSCIERFDSRLWKPRLAGVHRLAGPVLLQARLSPFSPRRTEVRLPEGGTVEEMLAAAGIEGGSPGLRVFLSDREVPRPAWARVRPRAGRTIRVVTVPTGGATGGKSPLRLILTIVTIAAVAIAAPLLGPGLAGLVGVTGPTGVAVAGALAGAAVGFAGYMLTNALAPPPRARLTEASASDGSSSPTISGARNSLRPYQPVPSILGRHRVAPPYAAPPYTEVVGDAQYLRCLFAVGYGPLETSEYKIGETPLDDYEGIELEVRPGTTGDDPVTLYPGSVIEDPFSILLEQADGWTERTTAVDADEISVDVTFPQGLATFAASGTRTNRTVQVEVEYRAVGSGTWLSIPSAAAATEAEMNFRFRTPEATKIVTGVNFNTPLAWGGAYPGTRPAYLPSSDFSWGAAGYVFAPADGSYEFALDCSDAGDLRVAGRLVASWYGSHAADGSFGAHAGSVTLTRGWHALAVRMDARGGNTGTVAVAWRKPGDVAFALIPAANLSKSSTGQPDGTMTAAAFALGNYGSLLTTTAARTEQIRRTLAWPVPQGQYEVRVRRNTADSTASTVVDQVYFTAIRAVRKQAPVTMRGVCLIALRIKATDQLNGVVDDFNCVATSIVKDWDAGLGQWVLRGTSNPAALYRHVLQGPANRRPVADSRLDLPALREWHEACEDLALSYNAAIDFRGTVYERLRDVASAGRASVGMRDGLYSIVRDRVLTVPAQHLTPRNSRGFRGRRSFASLPHALRVRFLDASKGWADEEITVYADGYTSSNATEFESLELLGITDADLAWRHGRYHLAVARLRRETYELETDVEHLVAVRGDLVLVTHDVPSWGAGYGRVLRRVLAGSDLAGLELDAAVEMEVGETYAIRVRRSSGGTIVRAVATDAGGERTDVTFVTPIPAGDPWPAEGDLWMFGRMGEETRELVIKAIEMTPDLGARLTLVDHAPAVHTADTGTIPPFDPGISSPPDYAARPDPPVIESIQSDDLVMVRAADGSLLPRMVVQLRRPSGLAPVPQFAQARTRVQPLAGAAAVGEWTHRPLTPIDGGRIIVDGVEQGVTYDLAVRVRTPLGASSDWTTTSHTVVGKTRPPPDVASLTVTRQSDGSRRHAWELGVVPPDIAGVRLRYGPVGTAWESMTPLHAGVLQASPAELADPPEGTWDVAVKAVDTSGNESTSATIVTVTLGSPRVEGVALEEEAGVLGWPGTKTNCRVNAQRRLEINSARTWTTLPATWTLWDFWAVQVVEPMTYVHTIDLGASIAFSPSVVAIVVEGAPTLRIRYSTNGTTYTAWFAAAGEATKVITARYVQVEISMVRSALAPWVELAALRMQIRAETRVHELQDLSTATLTGDRVLGPGDFRLPVPAGMFNVVRAVALSFNGMGPGWSWELVDRDATVGPRVRIYDADRRPANATIDATIRGY